MKGAFLVLLFCLAEADDVWYVVKGLTERLSNMEGQHAELAARLRASERKVEELQTKLRDSISSDRPKVAFSVGLGRDGHTGPYDSQTTVVYKRIHTNIGNAYNPSSGIFRAPLKGLYHFRFTASQYSETQRVEIMMYKNDQRLIYNLGYNNHDYSWEYVSNAIITELEEGDNVYMSLPSGRSLFDYTANNHNTFSGFLLYSM